MGSDYNPHRIGFRKGLGMKWVLNVVAVLCILVGGLWFFQGIGVLPGSFMSGESQWAIIGGIAIVVGIGLLIFTSRRGRLA